MDYWMNCMLYDWIMMNNPSFRMLYDWIYKKLMVFRDHNLVIFWLLTHPHMMKPYLFLVQATRSFWNRNITPQFMGIPNPPEKRDPSRLRNHTFKRGLVVLCHNCGVELCVYIYIYICIYIYMYNVYIYIYMYNVYIYIYMYVWLCM